MSAETEQFHMQRRNLVASALLIVLYILGDGKVDAGTLFGGSISFGRPWVLEIAAVVMLGYFWYRFRLYGGHEMNKRIEQDVWTNVKELLETDGVVDRCVVPTLRDALAQRFSDFLSKREKELRERDEYESPAFEPKFIIEKTFASINNDGTWSAYADIKPVGNGFYEGQMISHPDSLHQFSAKIPDEEVRPVEVSAMAQLTRRFTLSEYLLPEIMAWSAVILIGLNIFIKWRPPVFYWMRFILFDIPLPPNW